MPAWPEREVLELIARALEEDLGSGDLTTEACVPAGAPACGRFVARQELVLAGIELLPLIYELEPRAVKGSRTPGVPSRRARLHAGPRPPVKGGPAFIAHYSGGACVAAGEVIATISGPARRLLERERVALNFLQHLSGIATHTRRFVDAVKGTGVTILDTRKTIPGLRRLEKRAVADGGGGNHRFGLYDAVLIKENHIVAAGGVRAAVEAARRVSESVEVEVRNREELEEALEAGATRILLDNMTPEQVRACVARARQGPDASRVLVEVSGGVTPANVRDYALAGPDFISVGALTHSAPAADISFLLDSLRG